MDWTQHQRPLKSFKDYEFNCGCRLSINHEEVRWVTVCRIHSHEIHKDVEIDDFMEMAKRMLKLQGVIDDSRV